LEGAALAQENAVSIEGRRIHIRGTVQGVGFRPWIYRLAKSLGVTAGSAQKLRRMRRALRA
jgi:acylphosphatase